VALMMTDALPGKPVGTGLSHVFVSYSRRDQPYIGRLATWLHNAGIPLWMSGPANHCPAWQESVFPNIANCAALVVVMTPQSRVAQGVAQEVGYAESLGKAVIPVAVDDCYFLEKSSWPLERVRSCSMPNGSFLSRLQDCLATDRDYSV
jgi:hypothetical protein